MDSRSTPCKPGRKAAGLEDLAGVTGSQRWASVCERKKEGRKKEGKKTGREGRKKEGFICGAHISLNSAAALLCHLPWSPGRGCGFSQSGGTVCVRVPGTQQAVNKVRVTPTLRLLLEGVVAQGIRPTIFHRWLHHARGPVIRLQVSPREATEYQGLLRPLHPIQCVLMEKVSQRETQSTDVATSIPSLFPLESLLLTLPHLQPLGPYVLPTAPGLQYGWQVLPAMFGSTAG